MTDPYKYAKKTITEMTDDEVVRFVEETGAQHDPCVIQLLQAHAVARDKRPIRQALHFALAKYAYQRFGNENPFARCRPADDAFSGFPDFYLGRVHGSDTLCSLSYDDEIQHAFFAGATGAGKTTSMYLNQGVTLARSGAPHLAAFLPWDISTQNRGVTFFCGETRRATAQWLQYADNLHVFTKDTFPYSPWQPIEGVDDYGGLIDLRAGILCAETEARSASRMLLLDIASDVCRKRGVYDGSQNYPSLYDIYDAVESTRFALSDRRARQRETLLSRVSGLLRACPKMFRCRSGIPIDEIDRANVVLELPSVSADIRNIIFSWIFNDIYAYRHAKYFGGRL